MRNKFLQEVQKISRVMKELNISPVSKVNYAFDPYTENTTSIRRVMASMNTKHVLHDTQIRTKIDVKSDKSKPEITVDFSDGHKVIFKTEHLKASEILEKINTFCKSKVSQQPESDIALHKMSGKPKKRK